MAAATQAIAPGRSRVTSGLRIAAKIGEVAVRQATLAVPVRVSEIT